MKNQYHIKRKGNLLPFTSFKPPRKINPSLFLLHPNLPREVVNFLWKLTPSTALPL